MDEERIITGDTKLRVWNLCRYSIGVTPMAGHAHAKNIKPNSFIILTVDDILFIEAHCGRIKMFAQRYLVAKDEEGVEVPLEEMDIVHDDDTPDHLTDAEIEEHLKMSTTKIAAWLDTIEDPAELYNIYKVAVAMDLSASKLKILQDRMPERDMLNDPEENAEAQA